MTLVLHTAILFLFLTVVSPPTPCQKHPHTNANSYQLLAIILWSLRNTCTFHETGLGKTQEDKTTHR